MGADAETEALVRLALTPGLGPVRIRRLINKFGSAKEAFSLAPSETAGLPRASIANWGGKGWEEELQAAEKQNISILPYFHPEFPQSLLELPAPPALLYVKGAWKPQKSLAIVGTRNCSIYGKESAHRFGSNLAAAGIAVVSGLARGVDTAAHSGALEAGGTTIAVIGSGLCHIYPRENGRLAEKIAENGAVVSEYPLFTPPDRQSFPRRNRIIAAGSLGTLLIEAPVKSGGLITMEVAESLNRKCYALPGRVDDPYFQGNHKWLKEGRARLVSDPQDLLNEHQPQIPPFEKKRTMVESTFSIESEELELLKQLPFIETGIDRIADMAKLPVPKLHVLLMSLILKGLVKEYPGKCYKKVNDAWENP